MKPESIKKFDMFYLGSVVVSVIGTWLGRDAMMAQVNAELAKQGQAGADMAGMASGAIWVGLAVGVGISLLLWALISVWRIDFAKWILALLVAYGVLTTVMGIATTGFGTYMLGGIVATALSVAAVYFLFQPDAKAWLQEKRG